MGISEYKTKLDLGSMYRYIVVYMDGNEQVREIAVASPELLDVEDSATQQEIEKWIVSSYDMDCRQFQFAYREYTQGEDQDP